MTKSYKMLLLLAMLNEDKLPGAIGIDELVRSFARLARRSSVLRADVGDFLEDPARLRQHVEKNPIDAWAGGRGTGGTRYFSYEDGSLRTTFDVSPEHRPAFQELVREIADWRLGEYLDRGEGSPGVGQGFVCKVSHSSGRPILFLPDRIANPEMPQGWTDVSIEGKPYQANFAKVAVNVLREPGNSQNELPALLRRWFGPDAGLPGTSSHVVLERVGSGWTLRPRRAPEPRQSLQIGESYPRKRIPEFFGARSSPDWERSGFVWEGKNMILLVTLEKAGQPKEHQYEDRFLSPNTFQWQSQNRTTQRGKVGQAIQNHLTEGIHVHLFARRSAKEGQETAPFFYCGR